jgi:YHS domain-containing protein
MMNNKYFAKEQIPVEANGKTYYGCCQGCAANLKSNDSIRHTADPLTGEDVDKADAYIVLKPDGSDAVLYFKSAENYLKYIEKNKTQ